MVGANLRAIPASYRLHISVLSSHISLSRSVYAHLQLSERETATSAHAAVVLDGGASHNGAELVDWAGSDLGGFLLACDTAAVLAAGL
jgi:hypothetical protein